MLKPARAASRFALGVVATFAFVFGGLAAPAAAADDPVVDPPVAEMGVPIQPAAPLGDEDSALETEIPSGDEAAEEGSESESESESEVASSTETVETQDAAFEESMVMGAMAAEVFEPRLDVFLADGVTPAAGQPVYFGDTIVVRGSGYDPDANISNRPPVTVGDPTGVYVIFGSFADDWQPSASAPSSARKSGAQKWAIPQASLDNVDPRYKAVVEAGAVELTVDGTFEAQLVVTEPSGGALVDGNYGVYTYAAGGPANPEQELAVLLDARERPQLDVFLADGVTPAAGQPVYFGDEIVVRGTGYDPDANISNRPPVTVGDPTGVYVVFGSFADVWAPSTGARSDARRSGAQKWAIPQASLDNIDPRYKAVVEADAVELTTSGTFEARLVVTEPSSGALVDGNYGIYTYAAGGPANPEQELAVLLDATERPAAATATALSPSATSVTAGAALTLTATVTPTTAPGTVRFLDGATELGTAAIVAGAATLTIAPATGARSYTAQFVPADPAAYASSTSPAVGVQVNAAPVAATGSLSWAIKASFNDYMVSTAGGSISVAGGASGLGGGYRFPQTTGGDWSTTSQTGTVRFAGSVRYLGHGGVLDVTIANPAIVVHSGSSATLYVNGTAFATLNLAAASKSVGQGGDVTWSGVPATLTAAGAPAFAGFYSAGETLAPLTFTAGSASSGIGGGTVVVASAAPTQRTPAPTPPATTGVTIVTGSTSAGGTITIEAAGYQPFETGILIVIYSEPMLLGTVTADAAGVARWTGVLPTGLTGSHTLTMQGSVSHGVPVAIAPAVAKLAPGACTVDDATLTWGFKESFRAYLTSSFAGGAWTVADGAAYATPDFSWTGAGSYDPERAVADIAFTGSIRFTAHDGALDTTVANPRIELTPDGAVLYLDVAGTTQDGVPVSASAVEFATLDLSGVSAQRDGDEVTWRAIPAVLTEAGSTAFGTYEAGEVLDPVTLAIVVAADCATASDLEPAPEVTTAVDGSTGGPDLAWLWWLLGGLVLAAAIVWALIAILRRRSAS